MVGPRQIDRRLGARRPGHAQQVLQALALARLVGMVRRHAGQPVESCRPRTRTASGQRGVFQLRAQVLDPVGAAGGVRLAEIRRVPAAR